jgi:hypothetical protein
MFENLATGRRDFTSSFFLAEFHIPNSFFRPPHSAFRLQNPLSSAFCPLLLEAPGTLDNNRLNRHIPKASSFSSLDSGDGINNIHPLDNLSKGSIAPALLGLVLVV